MASPCTNDPSEVISAVVGIQSAEEDFERELDDAVDTATENANKFDQFVNGTDTQTVQFGEGAPTPSIRNTVRQMMSAAATLDSADVSGKSSTANGGSEMRTLAERFGDIVNVSDFGAKGDGITDDTAAFEAAAATGKSIFIPKGSYNLSKSVTGKFYSNDSIVFANAVCEVFCTAYLQSDNRKAIRFKTPIRFTDYDAALAAVQSIHSSAVNLYPQACCHGVKSGEEYLFILFNPGPGPYSTMVLAEYNITQNTYEKYYLLLNTYGGEALVYISNGSTEYVYVPNSNETNGIYKFILTGINGAQISPTSDDFSNINGGNVIFSRSDDGDWLVFGGGEQSASAAPVLTLYNDDAQYVSQVAWDRWNFDASLSETGIPHKQGLFYDSGNLYIFAGGNSYNENDSNLANIGVIQKDLDGNVSRSSVCDCVKIRSKLAEMFGQNVVFTENEGGYVYNGKVYSLDIAKLADNSQVIFLLEEFSRSANSEDFSECMAYSSNIFSYSDRKFFPTGISNTYKNPYTGETLSSLNDFLFMMASYRLSEIVINTAGTGIVPQVTVYNETNNTTSVYKMCDDANSSAYRIRITTATAKTFYIEVESAYSYEKHDVFLTDAGVVRAVGGRAPAAKTVALYGDTYVRMTGHITGQDKECGMIQVDTSSSSNHLTLGGGGGSRPQIVSLDASTASAGQSGGDTFGVILSDKIFRPNASNLITLGHASFKWKDIYVNTATLTGSDARIKDEVEDISENVLKAWGDVRFKVFKFLSAIDEKGSEKARIHTGIIAQDVQTAFASRGLDANRYGLFCYDEWEDQYEYVVIPGSEDETGKPKTERQLVVKAGNIYSIRYEEALVLECAYQRWLGEKRDARIAELEARLNKISGRSSAPSGASTDNL